MEIKGKVHCFFEQSGTFKNEFIKLGIPAEDYDIQNNFNETDHVMDLFSEIDNAYEGKESVFDGISQDDLIVAFYPCIYFCTKSQGSFYLNAYNYRALNTEERIQKILKRADDRTEFYERLIKFVAVCLNKKIRMIFENPWTVPHYLQNNFLKAPTLIDKNRLLRGDYFKKPTAYWFWNCEPTHGFTEQNDKVQRKICTGSIASGERAHSSTKSGLCSEERSIISPDYARNWICDFVIGKTQQIGQLSFEF